MNFRIALLTSSRADYSIYLPLIRELTAVPQMEVEIIAFGNHNSELYGTSANRILEDGFTIAHRVDSLILGDTPEAIADAMGLTMIKFSKIWSSGNYNMILCLGDRFEMFAAVSASKPFGIPVAHISGGETTLGAIDNVFRGSLTLMSDLHFVSAEPYKEKVEELIGSSENVFNVGALSIDNLKAADFYSIAEFKEVFGIDLAKPSILITFHPETVSFEKNEGYVTELIAALGALDDYQLIITMPNADTMGNMVRTRLNAFIASHTNAVGIESFGTRGYLSCMKYCKMMLGNTSSGFVEASYFPTFVINLGDRQKGRLLTSNIYSVPIERTAITDAVHSIRQKERPEATTMYGTGDTAVRIANELKKYL